MNQQQKQSILSSLRSVLFLLPGAAAVVLVCLALNRAPGESGMIPELLPLPTAAALEEAETQTPEPAEAALLDAAQEPEAEQAKGSYPDGVYTGSARGYGGTVQVQVTVQEGQITEISILSASGETDAFFNRAMGVVPKVMQAQSWQVDTVSGATYSSRGILGAIENALTGAAVANEAPPPQPEPEPIREDSFQEPAAYRDGTYTGTAQGFGGDITVEVTIREGKLSGIRIVSASGESGSYLSRAEAVISRVLDSGSPNVDTVSGATYSSNGILNAVKRALGKAATEQTETPTQEPEKPSQQKPAKPTYRLKDGVYTGTGEGFGGDITVQITVKKGRITKVTLLDAAGETAAYLNRAKQLCDSIVNAQSAKIDGISGATYSSRGILQGAGEAIDKAAGRWKDPTKENTSGKDPVSPVQEPDPPEDETGKYIDGTYTATGWCSDEWATFRYELTVAVTVEQGRITALQVIPGEDQSDDPSMNDSFFQRAMSGYTDRTGAVVKGIPDRVIQAQGTDGVDAVSRATYTSNTLLSLTGQALAPALLPAQEPEAEPVTEPETEPTEPETEPTEPVPSQQDTDRPVRIHSDRYQDGTYTATLWCSDEWETFLYEITATVTVEQGRIVSVRFSPGEDLSDYPEENDYYYNRGESGYSRRSVTVEGIPAQVVSMQGTVGVDGVSGATYSSDTMIDLCSKALSTAVPEEQETETPEPLQPSERNQVQKPEALAVTVEPEAVSQEEESPVSPATAEPETTPAVEEHKEAETAETAETDGNEEQAALPESSPVPEEETKALPEPPEKQETAEEESEPAPEPEEESPPADTSNPAQPEDTAQEAADEQENP